MYEIKKFGMGGGEFFLLSTKTHHALIDSGFSCCAKENAEELKKHINHLDYIILTHSHYDHAGGSPFFKRVFPEAKVVSSEYAAYVFTRPGAKKLIREMTDFAAKGFGITGYEDLTDELITDIPLKPGEKIDLGDMSLVAIDSSGHTKCCFSYYSPEKKLLIAAETLGVPLSQTLVNPCCLISYGKTIESIKRAEKLDIEAMLLPHGYLLSGKEKCKAYFELSKKSHEETRKALKDAANKGMNKDELIAILKENFYTEETRKIQPEKAFYLNAGYIIDCMLKE